MRKNIGIVMFMFLLLGTSLVHADDMKDNMKGKGMKGGMMDGKMMGKGMMDGKMMGMCPMMKSMMERSVVATTDGGVVVVTGTKLTKYDKNLSVVKEVEVKMDMEGMKKMMEHMKNCPMMEKGMMGGMNKVTQTIVETKVSDKEVDHASHH